MKKLIVFLIFCAPLLGAYRPDVEVVKTDAVVQKDTAMVTICTGNYSKRYHKKICQGMKVCKGETKKVSLSEAKRMGKTPCGICYK